MTFWTAPTGLLLILVFWGLVVRFARRFLKRRWPASLATWDLVTPLLILESLALGPQGAGQLLPWLIMGWMLVGVVVAIAQAVRNHELLYPVYFKTFWRLTDLYWTIGFIICFLLTIS